MDKDLLRQLQENARRACASIANALGGEDVMIAFILSMGTKMANAEKSGTWPLCVSLGGIPVRIPQTAVPLVYQMLALLAFGKAMAIADVSEDKPMREFPEITRAIDDATRVVDGNSA